MLSRRVRGSFVALTMLFTVLSPTAALAAGGSAADNQYQDPLGGTSTAVASGSGTSTGKGKINVTVITTPTAATGTTTTTAHGSGSVKTAPSTLSPTAPQSIVSNPHPTESLPQTGLNVEAIAFVGMLLVAGGLVLRWRIAR